MPNQSTRSAESNPAFENETPAEKLAQQVNDKVAHNLFDAAYADLKKGVAKQVADMPLKEKQAFFTDVASHLDEGAMAKLSAVFINENRNLYDRDKNGQLTKSELSQSTQALDPFYKGLGTEAVKHFDVASSLKSADGVIDADEAKNFVARQKMSSQDKYTDDVVANVIRKLAEPTKVEKGMEPESAATKAMEYLNTSMSGRAALETSEESQATWTQLAEKLKQNGLVEKLSMAYLKENRDNLQMKDENAAFSMGHLNLLKKSINPVQKQFAEYVSANFANIAEVRLNDPLTMISEDERKLYERKMNPKPQTVEAKPKQ